MSWKVLSETSVEFTKENVLYYRCMGSRRSPYAVDPDGGPYMRTGICVNIEGDRYYIKEFSRISNSDMIFKVTCAVEKVGSKA